MLGADRIRTGDAVIAMASSGLHSNGYSLVRHVSSTRPGWALDRDVEEFGRTLGEELLEPTRIYSLDCLALIRTDGIDVHAFCHVTGGGLAANLARVIPGAACTPPSTARPGPRPAVFDVVGELGRVPSAGAGEDPQHGRRHGRDRPGRPGRRGGARGGRADLRPGSWVTSASASTARVEDGVEVVHGAKGVDGGSVQVVGTHPPA